MKTITLYESFDQKQFETAEACREYESQHVESRICGLDVTQVRSAIAGTDAGLRDALEEVGRRCSVARRDAGEFRRAPKKQRSPDATQAAGATAAAPSPSAAPATPAQDDADGE